MTSAWPALAWTSCGRAGRVVRVSRASLAVSERPSSWLIRGEAVASEASQPGRPAGLSRPPTTLSARCVRQDAFACRPLDARRDGRLPSRKFKPDHRSRHGCVMSAHLPAKLCGSRRRAMMLPPVSIIATSRKRNGKTRKRSVCAPRDLLIGGPGGRAERMLVLVLQRTSRQKELTEGNGVVRLKFTIARLAGICLTRRQERKLIFQRGSLISSRARWRENSARLAAPRRSDSTSG